MFAFIHCVIEHSSSTYCVFSPCLAWVWKRWSLGRGRRDVEGALLVPEVGTEGRTDRGDAGKVRLQGRCEHLPPWGLPPARSDTTALLGVLGLFPLYGCRS